VFGEYVEDVVGGTSGLFAIVGSWAMCLAWLSCPLLALLSKRGKAIKPRCTFFIAFDSGGNDCLSRGATKGQDVAGDTFSLHDATVINHLRWYLLDFSRRRGSAQT
jgi:hypothetical protein